MNEILVLQKLESLEKLMFNQGLLKKEILTFQESCLFLDLSASHLYRLTSKKQIPFYRPSAKKIVFKRTELECFLLKNREGSLLNDTSDSLMRSQIDKFSDEYLIKNPRVR